jgi:hypothetical protein
MDIYGLCGFLWFYVDLNGFLWFQVYVIVFSKECIHYMHMVDFYLFCIKTCWLCKLWSPYRVAIFTANKKCQKTFKKIAKNDEQEEEM